MSSSESEIETSSNSEIDEGKDVDSDEDSSNAGKLEDDMDDLNASLTESDISDSEESSEDDGEEDCADSRNQHKTKADIVKDKILNKYQDIKGKQLYIRFPQKLPLDEEEFQEKAKALSPKIIRAHKPRQKHARFCLVDFSTKEDRDETLKKIKQSKEEAKFKGIFVSIPRTESEEFVNELVERKQKSIENKKLKAQMKRASKQAQRAKNFTSSIVITNLPKSTSTLQLRNIFPNAVDIQTKPGKGKRSDISVATVTLPSTQDARSAVKQKLAIEGVQLVVNFNKQPPRKRKKNVKNEHSQTLQKKVKLTV